LTPDTGTIQVLGLDVATRPLDVRARIGYMPESDAQMPGMSAVSFVAYCAELSGLPAADAMQRAHEVLFYVGLGEARYRNVETYSTGMKQRIKLAQALVHDPDVLFLDEPTNGMDPKGREEMLALVRDIAHKKQISLILSSHVMPDVESVCDAVVVMNRGKVVMQGPLASLKRPAGHLFEVRVKGNRQAFAEAVRAQALECREAEGDVLRVVLPPDAGPAVLFASAAGVGAQVRHLKQSLPTLEDVFAQAMGEE
jgi:ABC-2 type transport system ATP-binding protein